MKNIVLESNLTRRQLRYLLFRIQSDNVKAKEISEVLRGWGMKTSNSDATELLEKHKEHYETQEGFSGWEYFAAPNVEKGWDIGIDKNDIDTKIMRPEKWWAFNRPIDKLVSRNNRDDGPTKIELEQQEKED